MSNESARTGIMTPARAMVIAAGWIGAGLLLRRRFRLVACDEVDGGGALTIYFLVTVAVLIWVNHDGTKFDLTYRRISGVMGLAVLAITLSACLPYSNHADACTS